jgi:hypothetical protein
MILFSIEWNPMKSLTCYTTNGPRFSSLAFAGPRAGWRIFFLLLTLVGISAGATLPCHGQAKIATPGGVASSSSEPAVEGMPRIASGHPYTLWDEEDVAAYKDSLATDKILKSTFEELRTWGDKRIAEPVDMPAHTLDADDRWTFPDFKRGYQDASGNWQWEWVFNGTIQHRAEDVSNLGMLYALTGNEKYAAFAAQILLAAADAYGYGKGRTGPDPHKDDHWEAYGFDGGDAGMFLAKICHGYDLIYNSSSTKDRDRIERGLIRPLAEHLKKSTFMYTTHDRWGMVCLYGLFIAGETLNEPSLRDLALFGPSGTKDKVTGGFLDCFKPKFFGDGVDGGAGLKIDDQMAAAAVLTAVAEVLWHHGVNLYAYQHALLKKSFDAALETVDAYNGSRLNSLPGSDAYQFAFRRYQDQRYVAVVRRLKPGFALAIGEHLPSLPISQSAK